MAESMQKQESQELPPPVLEKPPPVPKEKTYRSLFMNTGVTYSCPWPFQLPSPVSYSWHVVSTRNGRQEPTKTELKAYTVKCEFPKFQANTVWITWLGHASCLFTFFGECSQDGNADQLLKEQEKNTTRVLCDPNFSESIGLGFMGHKMGSKRYIAAACQLDDLDLPSIDALCISHNHMDHMDEPTLRKLAERDPNIHCYVPMGDRAVMEKFGFTKNVREMTWWETGNELVEEKGLTVTFTPASHWSGRGIRDRNCSLWGSFVLECHSHRVFFAGDTGYQDEIFGLIGKKYGPFNLAAIPIGCYEPREVFGVQHVSPKEAVVIHREVKSDLSVGIHWGAFRMTTCEGVLQPPKDLEDEMKSGNQLGKFLAIPVGASKCWPEPGPEPEPTAQL